ncbi:MAG: Modification methylase HhaI [candidate division BRC1 bacterium ADurb.BinA364]|nr:MAG: Modification methylase HhaI [candidate division BRC1 bacterium ADurb.BinA364]
MRASAPKPAFLDFFAGSGLVCEGLSEHFTPVWANDVCPRKAAVFRANRPSELFRLGPIQEVDGRTLPEACLSWGSFPCQDLSLAGKIGGIGAARSGLVWEWLRVMDEMPRRPPIAVAENVLGLLSAGQGSHYRALHRALAERGYKIGAMVLDAARWLPQSRQRVFVVAARQELDTAALEDEGPNWLHPAPVRRAAAGLKQWVWWRMPEPPARSVALEDLIDFAAPCFDEASAARLIALIPENHRRKMEEAGGKGSAVFPAYKRIRASGQVLELRFDGLAGCLRTPGGGSSKQFLVLREGGSTRARLMTVGEAAALMGVPRGYAIPGGAAAGYRAMGDAVAVPVARYLARRLLAPLARIA